MLSCWAQNPEDRPSSSQIYNISSCSEFPRLLDVLTFDEELHLSASITTRSRDFAGIDQGPVVSKAFSLNGG